MKKASKVPSCHYLYDMNSIEIKKRIKDIANIPVPDEIHIVKDTTNFTKIHRNMVIDLEEQLFLVRGDMYEARFSLEGYPKFWVKSTIDLSSWQRKIIKCVFNEEFAINVGPLNIKCFRSAEKEGKVLDAVKDNPYFMHGKTLHDSRGNPVRVVDFITGTNFYEYLQNLEMEHKEYFFSVFPGIMSNLRNSLQAIQFIHTKGLCHGDIRNDHIIIEDKTGTYRWIDFDLNQHFSDFDVWSIGNILLFAAGKGEHTFSDVGRNPEISKSILPTLSVDDASAYFKYRIINLKKLFPYIPEKLNNILMHFSMNTTEFYDSVDQILFDLDVVQTELGGNIHGND